MFTRFLSGVIKWCRLNLACRGDGIEESISPESREARVLALALKRVV